MRNATIVSLFLLCSALAPATAHAQDGSIVTWGANFHGECDVPPPNGDFLTVATGGFHCLAVRADGSLATWGWNAVGQCDVPAPNSGFVAADGGDSHSLGLKAGGTVVAWGYNAQGQCNVPEPNAGFVAISAGGVHSIGLRSDGTIVAWGDNNYGECNVPPPDAGYVAISAGGPHNLALKSDGTIVPWGWNPYGQCTIPEPNAGYVGVSAGSEHSLALRADGTVEAFGDNDFGQCDVPVPNAGFVAIAAGNQHSIGIKADGSIVAWGCNTRGQCNPPLPNSGYVAAAGGKEHSMGRRYNAADLGACCHPDATCTLTPELWCQEPAIWQGAGIACLPDPCGTTPIALESWTRASLPEGLRIRWEIPFGTTGAFYRAWRDAAAGPADDAPTVDAVLVSSAWIGASADGIVETLDPGALRGATVRYFLETSADGGSFLGPVEARWDPPPIAWAAGPTPFRGTVRFVAPMPGPAQATIFDPTGRCVRVLVRTGGDASLEWDGRDDSGRDLPGGAYLVRATSVAGGRVMRVVKLR